MKKSNVLYICTIIILLVCLSVVINSNHKLKTDKEKLANIENDSKILRDSLDLIKYSYLLVDNVHPMVVNRINESTGEKSKDVFLVIRDCHVDYLRLITGRLDTAKGIITDTTNDITIHDEESFNNFSLITDNLTQVSHL